jgi:hypothetical protein
MPKNNQNNNNNKSLRKVHNKVKNHNKDLKLLKNSVVAAVVIANKDLKPQQEVRELNNAKAEVVAVVVVNVHKAIMRIAHAVTTDPAYQEKAVQLDPLSTQLMLEVNTKKEDLDLLESHIHLILMHYHVVADNSIDLFQAQAEVVV